MIFPSYIFIFLFLPITLIGWYGLSGLKLRIIFMTASSYIFYGWWDYRFTTLLFASTALDYVVGGKIISSSNPKSRRNWLILAVCGNLGILGLFKYYNFFAESLTYLVPSLALPQFQIILPLGISFYTFQSLSYSVDLYRGRCSKAPDFLSFAFFVSLYPQLVAGPIVRYQSIEKQLRELPSKKFSWVQFSEGLWYFIIGLLKKIYIADIVAPIADGVFGSNQPPMFVAAWTSTLAYTLQLYFDFSGYSDMAIGLGKMIGFEFPVNFNSPYKSRNISEFWRRWHITLSECMRDYLFISLGGSQRGTGRTIVNLSITMLLGGLWHGAAWNYVLWGVYHGILLGIHVVLRGFWPQRLPNWVAVAGTFLCVMFGWVVFRAQNLSSAYSIICGLLGFNGLESLYPWKSGISLPGYLANFSFGELLVFALAPILVFFAPNSQEIPKPLNRFTAIILGGALLLVVLRLMKETPFLYFQF